VIIALCTAAVARPGTMSSVTFWTVSSARMPFLAAALPMKSVSSRPASPSSPPDIA
jgi:hypothetical protein